MKAVLRIGEFNDDSVIDIDTVLIAILYKTVTCKWVDCWAQIKACTRHGMGFFEV